MDWLEATLDTKWSRLWMGPKQRRHKPDLGLLLSAILLIAIGAIIQYQIGPALALATPGEISENYFFLRHIVSLLLGIMALIFGYFFPIKWWVRISPWIILSALLLGLAAVIIEGLDSRWLQIGYFSLQPVEILKFGIMLGGAASLAYFKRNRDYSTNWRYLKPVLVILAVATFIIVLLQKDLGSMVVVAAMTIGLLWASGFSYKQFSLVLIGVLLIGGVFILSEQYRRDRFATFLNPSANCTETAEGYQACQALVSIGSGGLAGKGFGRSVQVYGYLPEANNDSVFAIYAEITGFIGVLLLLALQIKLFSSIYRVAMATETVLKYIMTALLVWLGSQTIMNIGSMIGLLPLKGITLPYISYGGSSLLMVLLATGVALQISGYTDYKHGRAISKDGITNRRRIGRTRNSASGGRQSTASKKSKS